MRHSYADFRFGRMHGGALTDVHKILTEAIESAGFDANVVSNADDVGIIQRG